MILNTRDVTNDIFELGWNPNLLMPFSLLQLVDKTNPSITEIYERIQMIIPGVLGLMWLVHPLWGQLMIDVDEKEVFVRNYDKDSI